MTPLPHVLYIYMSAAAGALLLLLLLRRRDVQNRTQTSLPPTEYEFIGLVRALSDAVVVSNDAGVIIGWNQGAERIFGYAAAEVIGNPLRAFLSEAAQEAYASHTKQLATLGSSDFVGAPFALDLKRKGGTLFPGEVSVAVWSDDRSRYSGAIIRDITKRRHVEQERQRLALAVQQTHEAIVITDPAGNIVYVNPAFERVSGYGLDEVIGGKPSLLKSGKQDDAFYRDLWATITRGEVWSGSFINRRKDGTFYEEVGTISPLRDDEGRIAHFVAVKRDVTQERAIERQLRQSQKLEAVGALASGIAHEINTPMQFIGDSARYLATAFEGVREGLVADRRALLPLHDIPECQGALAEIDRIREQADIDYAMEEIPRALTRVLDGVGRVTEIVRAMKDFAHPEQRDHVPADLNRMLLTTLTVARNEYKHVADVETDLGDLPPVLCQSGELNQVFLNIIVNAAHAMHDVAARTGARGKLVLRTRHKSDGVTVEITDTGGGIPEAIRDRIFDPFFTTKPVGKGTGQGLAIAHSIVVDKHGGQLGFTTETGKGTTFTIHLPVGQSLEHQEAA